MKCARCDADTDDFEEDTNFYVQNLRTGEQRQANSLCDNCLELLNERIEKFIAKSRIELTPQEKKLRDYFD
jgi:hypothetical protein